MANGSIKGENIIKGKDKDNIHLPKTSGPFGVRFRSPMGEFRDPENPKHILSGQSVPTPGPLDYQPKLPPSGYHFSILGKNENERQSAIGPGASKYDIRDIKSGFDNPPAWTFGRKLSNNDLGQTLDTPSPSSYQHNYSTIGINGLAARISSRVGEKIMVTPGPSDYVPNPVETSGPKYSFGSKQYEVEESTPGPLDYVFVGPKPNTRNAPAYSIGKISHSDHDSQIPGPNHYFPVLENNAKAVSLKGFHKEFKIQITPGPANYFIPSTAADGPKCSILGRNIPEIEDLSASPGPNHYQPSSKLIYDSSPKYSLRFLNPKPKKIELTPGPCSYDPHVKKQLNNLTLRGRRNDKIPITPGPADYGPISTIGRVSATDVINSSRKPTKAINIKSNANSVSGTPGPADYVSNPTKITGGPSYSFRMRLAEKTANSTPSPNAYIAERKNEAPRITMKSRASPFVLVFPSSRMDTIRVNI